jgi:protein-tyrosine phosphatase
VSDAEAERLVPLEGALNVRDVGGYPTADGGRVRTGRLFRGDHLAELTEADVEALAGLGLRAVVDLRRLDEVEERPSRLPTTVVHRHWHPIGGDAGNYDTWLDRLVDGDIARDPVGHMITDYEWMVTERAGVFGEVVDRIADDDNLPLLYHCTAGKDRTGITTALVLSVCGVERETILDDYELTNTYRANRRVAQLRSELEAKGVDVDRVAPYFGAPRPALETTLALLDSRAGSVRGWLTGPAGVSEAALERLVANLVER